ncbi:hypothetical protein [Streptomyces sp. NPDC059010]|uniref:hypothetical protein n=1 Tax=Streptomyces sp. NPDC059010 TaxID=3346695 RepID=UPI003695B6D2
MSGWDGKHEPSEERGQAAWAAAREPITPPPWASARTQTFSTPSYEPIPAQPSPPHIRPAPARARRLLLVVVTAAVLGAGVGTGVWFLIRDDSTAGGRAGGTPLPSVAVATPSASAGNSPSASAADSPSASASLSSPAGYRRAQDPVGYTLHVPEGWIRRQEQGEKAPVVRYDSPDGERGLQIFALSEDTPAESLDLAENDPGYGYSAQPGYQPLQRASAAGWSELTYRYDDQNKGPRQVIDHRFEATDGTLYAIRAAGPGSLAPELVREPLTAALESFCPAGADCR